MDTPVSEAFPCRSSDWNVAAVAAVLVGFVFVGAVTGALWLVHRFTRVNQGDFGELDKMAKELHEAEEERDQVVASYGEKEAEITNQLNQTQAELDAAMEGLRVARAEAEDLRDYIERMNAAD